MILNEQVFSLRLQKELYAKLKAISEEDKRSMNSWLIVLIEKEIKRHEAAQAQPNDYGKER